MKRREFIGLIGGAAIVCPLGMRAQQAEKIVRIAVIRPSGSLAELANTSSWQSFVAELRHQGYVEGQNLIVGFYSAFGQTDKFADVARMAVASQPNVIFSITTRLTKEVKATTTSIPIVALTSDPVTLGLVPSLAHPAGNITGITVDAGIEFYGKQLQFLHDIIPAASKVGILAPRGVLLIPAVQEAGKRLGLSLFPMLLEAPVAEAEYRRAFTRFLQERVDAVLITPSPEHGSHIRLILDLSNAARLPAICPDRRYAEQGGLLSYGANLADVYHDAARQIAAILKGERPGEIPFIQASRFELVVNLKAAKALHLTVPPSILARADEVIE